MRSVSYDPDKRGRCHCQMSPGRHSPVIFPLASEGGCQLMMMVRGLFSLLTTVTSLGEELGTETGRLFRTMSTHFNAHTNPWLSNSFTQSTQVYLLLRWRRQAKGGKIKKKSIKVEILSPGLNRGLVLGAFPRPLLRQP